MTPTMLLPPILLAIKFRIVKYVGKMATDEMKR
jgi:hypothetical protein